VGKAMREFRKATSEITNEMTAATQAKTEPAPADKASTTPETKSSSN
jgi:Sec-independent protein translocase protein TatA